jgi:hypothetical protein
MVRVAQGFKIQDSEFKKSPRHRNRAVATRLRRERLDFRKGLKVVGVESVDAGDAVKLHRGDNLQIENVASGDRSAAKQGSHFINSGHGNRQHAKETKHV